MEVRWTIVDSPRRNAAMTEIPIAPQPMTSGISFGRSQLFLT